MAMVMTRPRPGASIHNWVPATKNENMPPSINPSDNTRLLLRKALADTAIAPPIMLAHILDTATIYAPGRGRRQQQAYLYTG